MYRHTIQSGLRGISFALVVSLSLLQPWFGAAQNITNCNGPRTPGALRAALLDDYDSFTRPGEALAFSNGTNPIDAPPDVARIQLHVLSLNAVDQKRNEYELSVWFRRSWQDFRLRYTPQSQGGCFPDDGRVGFPEDVLKNIWQPDFYIENLAKPYSRIAGSVWVYPSGRVIHVSQLDMVLACQMQFDDFPRDVQTCGFRVGTFLEDAKGVTLDFFDNLEPVTLAQDNQQEGSLPHGGTTEWRIQGARGVDISGVGGATQAESTVEVQFDFARNSEYYSDFVITPAVMFVVIGWISFFLNRSAAPARVAMSMIGFLANTNFLAAQLGQLPRLGNDVWLLTFLSISAWFSFYAIVEYVVCNWLRRIQARIDGARKKTEELVKARVKADKKRSKKKKKHNNSYDEDEEMGSPQPGVMHVSKADMIENGFHNKMDLLMMKDDTEMYFSDEHVDVFSRYAYPITYLIVFLVMWFG
ncbi:acid receptor subunit [Seminavis robusta]|uniref:Acid receptor subunit n=1 Tax=Seminavis robusta TaxID=568900 RepID=A0A9N8HR80_9STRA|nr:acid receptor subunit [Seminavis robusta]|eukprot:Sro1535_g280550.1 acid receptor subunit (471) ;mRNA; r:20226-21638